MNKIFNCDCVTGMNSLPPQCVDLIITDPPFGIAFKSKKAIYERSGESVLDGYNEIDVKDYPAFTDAWLTAAKRVLKTSGAMFIFSGWNNLKDILNTIDNLGLILVNHLVWKY